ncbi:hypothetical protein ACWEKT_12500 [Nocardia takedensis]
MGDLEVRVSFPEIDTATADELCADLSDSLASAVPETSPARIREDDLAQDLGTALTLLVTSPTAALLIRELSRWAARRYDATVKLKRADTGATVEIKGPLNDRHERILREFLGAPDDV